MLKFYYSRLSTNARRVWIALLEKQIPFESMLMKMDGDQFHPDFLAINPFHKVPAIVDDGFRVIESLAILDYLEAKYPSPALMPKNEQAIAKVRMAQMIAVNELQPATMPLMRQLVNLEVEPKKLEATHQTVTTVLQFYESLLENHSYLAGEEFTLAEIVAGTLVQSLTFFNISLDAYPKLKIWSEKLAQRESWQQTIPSPEEIQAILPSIRQILESRE